MPSAYSPESSFSFRSCCVAKDTVHGRSLVKHQIERNKLKTHLGGGLVLPTYPNPVLNLPTFWTALTWILNLLSTSTLICPLKWDFVKTVASLKLTASLHLKNDAWKTSLSFWGPAYFQGLCHVSFREGKWRLGSLVNQSRNLFVNM